MMKFRDEQGNIVTPKKGDYVLASDIKDEAMHNRVREAFGAAGCKRDPRHGNPSGMDDCFSLMWDAEYDEIMCNHPLRGLRRIIPDQQTLFEAACEAEDGTRFKIGGRIAVKNKGTISNWYLEYEDGGNVSLHLMPETDFEQLPSGPKKRDVKMWTVCSSERLKFPKDVFEKCVEASDIIGRLMQWEGAQIGKPGFVIMFTGQRQVSSWIDYPSKYEVTFQTAEQCEAAWRDVCPEMFG